MVHFGCHSNVNYEPNIHISFCFKHFKISMDNLEFILIIYINLFNYFAMTFYEKSCFVAMVTLILKTV